MKSVWVGLKSIACLSVLALSAIDARSSCIVAIDKAKDHHVWVNIGGGAASVAGGFAEDNGGGVSGGVSVSLQRGANLYTIRAIGTVEFKLDLWGYSGPPDKVWDVGVLYGRVAKGKHGVVSVSAGVGLVGASHEYYSEPLRMGIPLDVQMFWTPGSTLGFGLCGFANWNADRSFAGMLVCIQICGER